MLSDIALPFVMTACVMVGAGGCALVMRQQLRSWYNAARFWRLKFEELEKTHMDLQSKVLLGHAAREILDSGDEIVRNPRVRPKHPREDAAKKDADTGNPFW